MVDSAAIEATDGATTAVEEHKASQHPQANQNDNRAREEDHERLDKIERQLRALQVRADELGVLLAQIKKTLRGTVKYGQIDGG